MGTPTPNWSSLAEQELGRLAVAVQTREPFSLQALSAIAAGLVCAVRESDQLVVEALSRPADAPVVMNLVDVGILATKVGLGLGYYGSELERLALAGLVHDIGLFSVPPSILQKAAKLTQGERSLVQRHPDSGAQLIGALGKEFDWLAEIVRQAHERWNGAGYPRRLKGRQIHEYAQIIGAVDVFDALVNARPYRRRLLPHEAIREMLVAERLSFPREVLKALLDQLSVYPLGTLVRLSNGEAGVVVKINRHYPLRPVVKVMQPSAKSVQAGACLVDLSLTPVLCIVETVERPATDRVAFAPLVPQTSSAPGSKPASSPTGPAEVRSSSVSRSDQFDLLLGSLDAIASTIRTLVEQKDGGRRRVEGGDASVAPPAGEPDGEADEASFRKEVLGLFALEAREWLGQIQGALKKLRQDPSPLQQARLVTLLAHGVTNLAKSAATVQLSSVEAMAKSLLPAVEKVTKRGAERATEELVALQEEVKTIGAVVQRLASGAPLRDGGTQGDGAADPGLADQSVSEAIGQEEPSAGAIGTAPSLIEALRKLHEARTRSVQPTRDVLEVVVQRAEREASRGRAPIDAAAIGRILKDLDQSDQIFLGEVQRRVPLLSRWVADLRRRDDDTVCSEKLLEPLVREILALYDAARKVNASSLMLFLAGLRSFLTVAVARPLAFLSHRFEAVEARLASLIPMAEQWVELGRVERAAISEILPR
jgi:hypothetical protein